MVEDGSDVRGVTFKHSGVVLLIGKGGQRRPNSWRKQVISFLCLDSLSFNCCISDSNSLRISGIISIGDSSVCLLVSIVEPPGRYCRGWIPH